MSLMDLKLLIFTQIGVDVVLIVLFLFFFRKFRGIDEKHSFNHGAETIASLLSEADNLAVELKGQLKEKKRLVNQLNAQLDQKIMSLKVLLKRSEYLINAHRQEHNPAESSTRHDAVGEKVIGMAREGCDVESIADRLSIPREKVKLLLDLRKNELVSDKETGVS